MRIAPGSYRLGPELATLTVRTRRTWAAAMTGHDLLIEVTRWSAELRVGTEPAETTMQLSADSTSLRVREGTGGVQALGDADRASIAATIDDKVLRRTAIEFRSCSVEAGGDGDELRVRGELELRGARRPIAFELRTTDDGELTARASVTQTEFGIRPYSTLFGALRVVDEVGVALDGRLPAP